MAITPTVVRPTPLRQWAERRNLSLETVAKTIGYSRRYLLDVSEGYRPVTDKLIGAFTRIYGPSATVEAFGLSDPEKEPLHA